MPKDLAATDLSQLTWEDGKRAECLTEVYTRVTDEARAAIDWYQQSRRPKKKAAMFLRWSAVLLVTASGLLPLISTLIDQRENQEPLIDPLFTSLAVALAAALFGLDKFFNFSAGWMRYVKTDLALRAALGEFEFEWQIARAAWGSAPPTAEQGSEMLARCKAFAASIKTIVAEETNAWITEFQASLTHLGESVKAAEARVEAETARRAEAARTGALNVVVKHNEQTFTGPIRLRVDDDKPQAYVGPNLALVGLAAGPHKLQAEVTIEGKTHRGEFSADVVPGKTSDASVTVAVA